MHWGPQGRGGVVAPAAVWDGRGGRRGLWAKSCQIAMANGILDGMKALTVDGAGRIVLPKPLREQFGLKRGSKLDLEVQPDAIVLRPLKYDVTLVEEDGLLVHEGQPVEDLLGGVERARDARDQDVAESRG